MSLLDTQTEYSRLSETVTKYKLKAELELAMSRLRVEIADRELKITKMAMIVSYALVVLFLIMLAATRPSEHERHNAATNTSVVRQPVAPRPA